MIIVGVFLMLAGLWILTQSTTTKLGAPLVVAGVVMLLVRAFH